MKLTGSYKLNVKKETVWQALNNPDILKQCIPGCESFEKESDTIFNAAATNQIGPMNATFSCKVTLSNIRINQSYTLSGEGKSSFTPSQVVAGNCITAATPHLKPK